MECKSCGSKNVSVDDSRAECVCEDCGCINEIIDSHLETEFEEMDNGRVVAVGNIIATGEYANKQNTINKASARINNLCSKLFLTKSLATYAVNIFKTALSLGMTRGRNAQVTAGACVYLAARIKQQSLMLLDVSDKLGLNVYSLGKTYNELKEKTGQKVSDVDPCLFISRFAMDLELGDKTEEVSLTALQLLQRMKKDWISTGRRPHGITAAALLIAARLHRFDRDCNDVAKISGVSRHTTMKRIQEWAETSTADLTWSQFGKIEYEDEFDPPAFTNLQKAEGNEDVKVKLSEEGFAQLRIEMIDLQKKIDDDMDDGSGEEQASSNGETVKKKGGRRREKLEGTYYHRLKESIERGQADVEALIGSMQEGEEATVEYEGRAELLGECVGLREAFVNLGKKEEAAASREYHEDELPVYLAGCGDNEIDGIPSWCGDGDDDGGDSIDEEELKRVYFCSQDESVMKLKWWLKENPDFYKNKKRSEEKLKLQRKQEEESGKKSRIRRQKRGLQLAMVDHEQLLKEILGRDDGPPVKRQNMEQQQEQEELQQEEEEEEETVELNYKYELGCEAEEVEQEEEIQFDYNEDD